MFREENLERNNSREISSLFDVIEDNVCFSFLSSSDTSSSYQFCCCCFLWVMKRKKGKIIFDSVENFHGNRSNQFRWFPNNFSFSRRVQKRIDRAEVFFLLFIAGKSAEDKLKKQKKLLKRLFFPFANRRERNSTKTRFSSQIRFISIRDLHCEYTS